jgi:hypothetical protein
MRQKSCFYFVLETIRDKQHPCSDEGMKSIPLLIEIKRQTLQRLTCRRRTLMEVGNLPREQRRRIQTQ